ncbi:MAG: PrsW family intramembrane metalloprotease, partial [Erysipelotrichaceae bacterium]|nr:PrsW family intramembrane metalloprotease [Erysipelotrichaceae bacterium]
EKEPVFLLLLLLIGGILSCIPAIILETVLEPFVNVFAYMPLVFYLVDAFIVVALSEEISKYFFLKLISWRSREFNSTFDGIIYSVFTGTGFALGENILYVFQYGLNTGITRAFTAIPAHVAFAVLMGVFYSDAKLQERMGNISGAREYRKTAVIAATIAHGLYDFCLFVGSDFLMTVWMGVLALLYIIIFAVVRARSRKDRMF